MPSYHMIDRPCPFYRTRWSGSDFTTDPYCDLGPNCPCALREWRRKGRALIFTIAASYGVAALIALTFFHYMGWFL